MQAKSSDDGSRERELKDQGTVLLHVLNRHPFDSSVWNVVSELVGRQNRHTLEWDRYEQAAWQLVSAGLLLAGYERIKPSRQALRFNEILNANGIL
jgi:hypothetical protein